MRGVAATGAYGEMHVTENGYCGIAPLGGDLANVAMVVPAAHATGDLRAASSITGFFLDRLAAYPHLGPRVRDAAIVAGPWTTSGLARSVRRRVDDALLLVGDAGGYYDPFTGEGIYRGLRSAELAADVAGVALRHGDVRAAALRPFAARYRKQFAPKRLVEIVVHEVTTRRPLFEHVADRLRKRRHMADALIGVTGDFLSPYEVLSPWYLARLLV
jgi:flavin-dependent dehydrogenase